jgi:hypothetical protein
VYLNRHKASENFALTPAISDCKEPPSWHQAQAYIYTNLDLIGNVTGKLDE